MGRAFFCRLWSYPIQSRLIFHPNMSAPSISR
jgi:hypothetical protein